MSSAIYDVKIKLLLKTVKKLNVGSAYAVKTKADMPFQRIIINNKEYYYIPGSTIKGVLRTALIRIAGLLGYKGVSWKVDPDVISNMDDVVIRLFGGPHDNPSKIIVEPVFIEVDKHRGRTLTHVKIDDKYGICEEGGLYTVEYLPIGVEFETTIRGIGLSLEEARALFASILELRFERIGKSGVLDVKIIKKDSKIPDDLLSDNIIKLIWEGIGI